LSDLQFLLLLKGSTQATSCIISGLGRGEEWEGSFRECIVIFQAPPLLYDGGHMAVTYSALAILRILGDDFSSVACKSVLKSVQALQQIDGRLEQSN
jgi:hypothetical protein